MKKIILFFLIFCSLTFFYLNKNQIIKKPLPITQQKPTNIPTIKQSNNLAMKQFLFLPYWSLPENFSQIKVPQITNNDYQITNLVYFGIAPNENGINKNEPGFLNLTRLNQPIRDFNVNLLVLRMTNSDLNFKILDDDLLQQKIIDQMLEIAKQHSFGGLILDLEVSALPFSSTSEKITNFVKKFSQKTKSVGLNFAITIYGDTFYRKRPYDLKNLTPSVDQLYVMAYDFHKILGSPGPNFPLNGREKYGYDLVKTSDDFLSVVPAEKLTFVFGLYGYDWTVDEKERPIKQAKALTLNQIKTLFDDQAYTIKRDPQSKESFIKYTDENNMSHIVWFEDEESIGKKQEFLKSKGITNFAYWAWGYY